MLEYIILGFLMYQNLSGYDVKQFMKHTIAHFYDASFGSIYPMLKKMEESGMVTAAETVDGGKYRKEYALTDRGREAFIGWLNQPITLNRARHDHLVRIFFFRWLPPDKAKELIAGFIRMVRGELSELQQLRGHVTQSGAGPFELATLDYGMEYYRFTIDWCERFLGGLNHSDGERKEGQL